METAGNVDLETKRGKAKIKKWAQGLLRRQHISRSNNLSNLSGTDLLDKNVTISVDISCKFQNIDSV